MSEFSSNFMDLDDEFSSYENSGVVIVPVPYEQTVTYGRGTSNGPSAIINASRTIEFYDDELHCEPADIGIHTLKEIDCEFEPEQITDVIKSTNEKLLEDDKFIINLGGEHTITIGSVFGFKSFYEEFSVLTIDAHCDLRDEYEGEKYCHATVMRRIVEEDIPIVEVGIRSYSKEESQFIINSENAVIFHANEIQSNNSNDWTTQIISNLKEKVYLSIDVDGFDPSIIPTTGTPEPGGLGWYQVLSLLKKLFSEKDVIGMDIVELAPVEGLHGPDVLAAKLAYKATGYKFFLK
ncbi:MAG: agmatinase [Thermodesulfobacteriota bacterium]